MTCIYQRRRSARHQAAEQTEQRRTIPPTDDAQREIAGEAHAGYQHHHEPDLARVEGGIGAERAVRQDRQDDERHHGELQDGHQVAPLEVLRQAVQLGLEIEQDGGGDRQHHRQAIESVRDHRAQREAQHERCTVVVPGSSLISRGLVRAVSK